MLLATARLGWPTPPAAVRHLKGSSRHSVQRHGCQGAAAAGARACWRPQRMHPACQGGGTCQERVPLRLGIFASHSLPLLSTRPPLTLSLRSSSCPARRRCTQRKRRLGACRCDRSVLERWSMAPHAVHPLSCPVCHLMCCSSPVLPVPSVLAPVNHISRGAV